MTVDEANQVSSSTGNLCGSLSINNQLKQIQYVSTPPQPSNNKLQVNYNTAFGITAILNNQQVENAELLNGVRYPEQTILKAIQQNKVGECILSISDGNVAVVEGVLCQRLNIVKEGNDKTHIYLPADIPDMGSTPPPPQVHYMVFGMDPTIYVSLNNHTYTNGMKLNLNDLNIGQYTLYAYQNKVQAQCDINYQDKKLMMITGSGTLCDAGLTLVKQSNGDYYLG